MKKKKNKNFVKDAVAPKRCAICFSPAMKNEHHWITVGAGGSSHPDNLVPLCFNHHMGDEGVHRGIKTFLKKYPAMRLRYIKAVARHRFETKKRRVNPNG